MSNLHQRGPLDRAIYVQTQTDHSKMSIDAKDTNSHTWLTQPHKVCKKKNTHPHKIHANMQECKTKIHMTHIRKKNTTQDSHKTSNKHVITKDNKNDEHNNIGGTQT